jgi:hypothetical protein
MRAIDKLSLCFAPSLAQKSIAFICASRYQVTHWLPMQESFPAAIRASDEADYESAGQD